MKYTVILKFFTFLVILLLAGCAAAPPANTVTTPPAPEANEFDESFDPVTLDDADIAFPEESASSNNGGSALLVPNRATDPGALQNSIVDGFRVQLYASKDIEKASQEKKRAEYRLAGSPAVVYVEFASPNYKVRIGDCLTRDDAEALRELVRESGYRDSFIVKSKVNTHPLMP